MKKFIFFLSFLLVAVTISAQDGVMQKKNLNIVKGIPTIRLIGTTPVLNFGTVGGKIDFYNSDVSDLTLTHSANTLTLAGGNLALGANNLTMTGSLAATGARVTKGWFTDIESTNAPTIGGIAMAKIMTVKKTIGGVGVAGCDFNFTTAANQTEQPINLGALVPAKSQIISVFSFTDNAFTGAVSLGVKLGTATGGTQIAVSADVIAANAINQPAVGAGFTLLAISGSAVNIWASATPGANWSLVTAGKMTVYVTYIAIP